MSDLIERQVVMDTVAKSALDLNDPDENWIMQDRIKEIPSAQPEPSTEIQEILNYLYTTLHPIISPDNWNVYAELHDMVSKLPSAQPEWIPCSERLPDEDVEVLVTDDAGGVANLWLDKMLRYEDSGKLFWLWSQNVTAWMPVPEPYEVKKDG